jgi:phosphoribosylformylglycinamidine synthase
VLNSQEIRIKSHSAIIFQSTRHELQKLWAETSYQMQSIRDNPACALAEFNSISDLSDPGIHAILTFDTSSSPLYTKQIRDIRPKVAVLREQGVNSHLEMAYAFYKSGFDSVDVHMSDVLKGKVDLNAFIGLACPGGFSYGDVLGAGTGWAKSILLNSSANAAFKAFFERKDTFTIGICNGCQMLSQLAEKNLIPGASTWPNFKRNLSEQFEGRVSTLQISSTNNSFWFKDMQGSRIPVAVAHGEGRAVFRSESDFKKSSKLIALQYIQNNGNIANPQNYPFNPNGSIDGIAGLTSEDGRVLILMPHPERVIRGVSNTWGTFLDGAGFGHESGWMRLFHNARVWVQN